MRFLSAFVLALAAASSTSARPFHRKPSRVLSTQSAVSDALINAGTSLEALLSSLEESVHSTYTLAVGGPLTCNDPMAELPVKAEFPEMGYPVDNVTVVDVETKGRAVGTLSVKAIDDTKDLSVLKKSEDADPSAPYVPSNVTVATSISATTPELLASLLLTPPTLLFDPLTGKLSFKLSTPTKFLLPTDCAVVKVQVRVPRTVEQTVAVKVTAAMMATAVSGTASSSDPSESLDFQSLDVTSFLGNVDISDVKVNQTITVLGVNGAVAGTNVYAGKNISLEASRGAVTLVNAYVQGNVSLMSVLAPVTASHISFNGSFNASSRLAAVSAAPITIIKDSDLPATPNSIFVWTALSTANVEITNPFDGTFNASAGYMSAPVITDADSLVSVVPGFYPARVSGTRGAATGLDHVEAMSKVGGASLKFGA